jgi:Flp pilus assembly protein TadD
LDQAQPTSIGQAAAARAVPLERWAAPAVALYTLVLAAVGVLLHPTPLYFVETDLLGEYIPAARAIAAGLLDPAHLAYHGPGYPLMLAGLAPLLGGDHWLAARLLSALSTGCAAWLAFVLVRRFAGGAVALFALAGLLANPAFLRYGVEAGTDAPALAFSLAATLGVLAASGPGALLGAGLAAALAILTRYNAAFLVPAAALVLLARPGRRRGLAWYAAGLALPLGAWLAVSARTAGGALPDQNYLNLAYELYGRDLPWDRFVAEVGSRFHSLGDVLRFAPAQAAGRVAWNLGAHFTRDLKELLPVWLGVLAGPGVLLAARRRGWGAPLLHAALCALTLAPVFYSTRFALYLLPFYLAGAGALLLEWPETLGAWWRRPDGPPAPARPLRAWTVALAALLLAGSAYVAVFQLHWNLADAPRETRLAGEELRRRGLAGGRIMARKPHVAYFAGMDYAPMALSPSLGDLLATARAARVGYLFYSGIERLQRPEYAVLSDSGLVLPGLAQVAYRALGGQRFYAVYRVAGVAPDPAALADSLGRALLRYADRRGAEPEAQVYAAVQLEAAGRFREALDRLLPLERAGARDPAVAKLLSGAYFGLGAWDDAARECELAMKLEPPTAWHWARLAAVRVKQGRYAEAREGYRRAVELEPGNPAHLERLGLACVALHDFAAAADAFDRCVRLVPRDAGLRRYAIGAYQLAGNPRRARQILEEGVRAGIPLPQLLGTPGAETPAPGK